MLHITYTDPCHPQLEIEIQMDLLYFYFSLNSNTSSQTWKRYTRTTMSISKHWYSQIRWYRPFQGDASVVVPYCYYLGKSCSFGLPRVPFVNYRQFMYLVISLLVLRAGCGIWLYQFLIIAYLFTSLKIQHPLLYGFLTMIIIGYVVGGNFNTHMWPLSAWTFHCTCTYIIMFHR